MFDNNYKTIGDLCVWMNEHEPFDRKWVSVKEVIRVFTKAHLFYFNEENNRTEPTDYLKNSGGCFITKSGKILFTEEFWNMITKDNKLYTTDDWLNWFLYIQKSKEDIKEPEKIMKELEKDNSYRYLAHFRDDTLHVFKGYSKEHIKYKIAKKYPKMRASSIKRI